MLATTEAPPTQWNKGYTELHGTGNCVIQTNDGGYALAGESDGKFLLVKASSTGDVQWWKTYQDGEAYSIVQTSDGGYALAGSGTLFNFVKTDSAGKMQWNKDYSKLGLPFLAKSLIQTSDGGYALAGWTSDWDWTIKTDSNGNMQWNKTYGTERAQSFVTSVVEADDGGYALTCNDMLIKIDSSGNVQWNRTYEFVRSLVKTKDSGYLLVGSAVVGSAWLVKTDSQGNMQWTNKYGINGTMNFNVFSSAVQTRDGGYVVAGATYPIYDGLAWIVKTNASGNMEWNVTYEPVKGSNSIANWIVETNDGGYAFTGSKGVGRGYTEPGDVWLVKIATTIPEPFPTWIVATTVIVLIAVVGVALLVYFRKVKKTTERAEIISEGVM
jgi:hypothetical protein